jgi:predicted ABC-type ATPase
LIAAGFSPFDPERAAIKAERLMLEEIELAIARVKQRVKAGGHNIPEETIRRRFAAGLRNYEKIFYRSLKRLQPNCQVRGSP